jgi:hypothetical protein
MRSQRITISGIFFINSPHGGEGEAVSREASDTNTIIINYELRID